MSDKKYVDASTEQTNEDLLKVENKELRDELDRLRSEALTQELNELKKKVSTYELVLEDRELELKQLNTSFNAEKKIMEDKYQNLIEEYKKISQRSNELYKENQEIRSKVQNEESIGNNNEELDEVILENEELKFKISVLSKNISAMQRGEHVKCDTDNVIDISRYNALMEKNKLQTQKIDNLEKVNNELLTNNNRLSAEISTKDLHLAKIDNLNDTISLVQKEKKDLVAELANKDKEIATLNERLDLLKRDIDSKNKETCQEEEEFNAIDDLIFQIDELKREKNKLSRQLKDQAQQLENTEKEFQTLIDRVRELEQENLLMKHKIDNEESVEAVESIDSLKSQIEGSMYQNQRLERMLEEKDERIKKLEYSHQRGVEEIELLNNEIRVLQKEKAERESAEYNEDRYRKYAEEKESLKEEIRALYDEIEEQKKDYEYILQKLNKYEHERANNMLGSSPSDEISSGAKKDANLKIQQPSTSVDKENDVKSEAGSLNLDQEEIEEVDVKEIQNQLDFYIEKCKILTDQKNDIEKQFSKAKAKLREHESSSAGSAEDLLQTVNNILTEENSLLTRRVASLQESYSSTKHELEELEASYKSLDSKYKEASTDLAEYKLLSSSTKEEVKQLTQENLDLKKALQQRFETEDKIKQLESKISYKEDQLLIQSDEISVLNLDKEKLALEIGKLNEIINSKEEHISSLNVIIAERDSSIRDLKDEILAKDDNISRKHDFISQLNRRVSTAEKTAKEAKKVKDSNLSEINDLKISNDYLSEQNEALEKEIEKLTIKIENLESQLDICKKMYSQSQLNTTNVMTKYKNIQKENDSLTKQLREIFVDGRSFNERILQENKDLAERVRTLSMHVIKYGEGKSLDPIQTEENNDVNLKIEALEVSFEQSKIEIDSLRKQLEDEHKDNITLRKKLNETMKQRNILELRLDPDFGSSFSDDKCPF